MTSPDPRRRVWIFVAAGVLVLAAVALAITNPFGGPSDGGQRALATVKRGPLRIGVSASGTLQNREQVVIKNEVEGRTAILNLVQEGTQVKPGDLLVELDSASLVEQKRSQQITVINAEAGFVRAREGLAVARSQAESDIAQAELDLKFAELDRAKYVDGEYPQAIKEADAEITIAHEEVQRATDKLAWSKKLHDQRYLSLIELQADELALKKAQLNHDVATSKKRVLQEYTHEREMQGLQSAIEQARMALERVKRQSAADLVQAEADLRAKEQELERQKSQLEKLDQQIEKCTIRAPVAGLVVYATTGGDRWRDDEPLQEGQEIRERQELIYLPTASSMKVEVKIHESALEKVSVGMPVQVTVDAAAGRMFGGRVARIAPLPDAQSRWLNPDLKVYSSDVHILGDASDLRAGMSCRVEIIVERHEDALYVPIQCVVREAGQPKVYVREGSRFVARPVEIGLDNNQDVHILSGVDVGEQVLLTPPLDRGQRLAPAQVDLPAPDEPAAEAPAEKPTEPKVDETPADDDERAKRREEMRKRLEGMTPEERAKAMEEFRNRRNREGGGTRGSE